MPSIDQLLEARDLLGQGQTTKQVAEALGIDVGDVESVRGGGMFLPAEAAKGGGPFQIIGHDFQHDTPGLTDGVPVYTPKVGDVLFDAWLQIDEAWNGTTPQADVGSFVGNGGLMNSTWSVNAPWDLTLADVVVSVDPSLKRQPSAGDNILSSQSFYFNWATTDPLKLVVSQNGQKGGADPGATQGKATLFVLIGTRSN